MRIYDCGLTVYNYAHIGNLARYLMSDLLRRVLVYFGYTPYQVQNVTDVGHLTQDDIDQGEDKIMIQAAKEGLSPQAIANKYLAAFLANLDELRILRPHEMPKATEHVPEMIAMIKRLEKRGYTYMIDDGVYFDVTKFPNYGKLSGNSLADLAVGARVEVNPQKHHPADFSLWKKVGKEHLMKWDSPWGVGCPGWHIECSAMAQKYLGNTLDLHSGGEDNIFPHHESEIAQAEGANDGVQFCHHWLHRRHLLVDGKKMAKRACTAYTLKDLAEKGYSPLTFRFLVLSAHYRKQLNFTLDSLQGAQAGIDRLNECIQALLKVTKKGRATISKQLEQARQAFKQALANDLNTPEAVAVVFSLVKEVNRQLAEDALPKTDAKLLLNFLRQEVDSIFAVMSQDEQPTKKQNPAIKRLMAERVAARAAKDWAKADQLRAELQQLGVDVRDGKIN